MERWSVWSTSLNCLQPERLTDLVHTFSATPVFVLILFHLFLFFPFLSSLFPFSPLIQSTSLFPFAHFPPLLFASSSDFVFSFIPSFLRFIHYRLLLLLCSIFLTFSSYVFDEFVSDNSRNINNKLAPSSFVNKSKHFDALNIE